ncbi:hypothetical protein I6F10_01655 [Pseudoalteromonas sp. SWYJZ98]|uniref:DUF6369 family protein n=1 Tax=Pseudoalteromonas sp. SWYJZ98 TaxID=2792060 RepID=UPI0018CDD43A|nr:DUF6369 family protein [Pseudoalteromonas sp. SWYJZ98]MBH0029635.1 hypothetical protein [Pseudoalteromonas sp. SWYJZ98]
MFYILSFTFFLLGLRAYKNIIPFVIFIFTLPFGNAFSEYFYKSGLYSYDFFFFAIIALQCVKAIQSGKLMVLPVLQLIGYLVVFLYFFFGAYLYDLTVYFVRDLRLFLFLIYLSTIYSILRGVKFKTLKSSYFYLLISFGGGGNLIILALSFYGFFSFDDGFYSQNSFRYFDLVTYVCSIFLIFHSPVKPSNLYLLAFLIAALCVLVSGIRVLILMTVLFFLIRRLHTYNMFIKIIALAIFLIILTPFLDLGNTSTLLNRISDLSVDVVLLQFYTRYSPFFSLIESFEWYNYFIGKGFGTTFFIPWFEYRETKDELNNFIDSTYLTLYAKFGIISILYVFSVIFSFLRIAEFTNLKDKYILVFYCCVLMLVYSLPYQASSIGLIIGFFLINIGRTTSNDDKA